MIPSNNHKGYKTVGKKVPSKYHKPSVQKPHSKIDLSAFAHSSVKDFHIAKEHKGMIRL